MLVETYEVAEVTETGVESSAEAIQLCEQLGLTGQLKMGADASGKRMPYRKMTALEGRIYSILCPRKTPIAQFADEPIPLRVLQVAAHARPMFDALVIWHPENADIKDPVLVGIKGNEWNGERYILARWGEVLDSLETLKGMAAKLARSHLADHINGLEQKFAADKAKAATLSDDGVLAAGLPFYNGLA